MRLNKKKLAALAMSAVMAASTMPFPVLAEEFTDGGEATVVEAQAVEEAPVYTVDGVSFDKETGKATFTLKNKYDSTDVTTETRDSVKTEVSAATCTKPATYQWKVTAYGKDYLSDIFSEGDALGHDWKKGEFVQTKAPTCTTEGEGYYVDVCTRCGEKRNQTSTVKTEKAAHTFGTEFFVYTNPKNIKSTTLKDSEKVSGVVGQFAPVLDKNGKPQLDNTTLPGEYTVETYHTCSKCGTTFAVKDTKKTVTLTAEDAKEGPNAVTEVKGVVDEDASKLMGKTLEEAKKVDLYTLVMKDCNEAGSYVVSYYGMDGKTVLRTETYEIPKHHAEVYAEPIFKTQEDQDNCTLKQDAKTGRWTVINNTCNKVITYTQKVTCKADNCKYENKTSVEVQPTGDHVVVSSVRAKVKDILAKKNTSGYMTKEAYAELEKYVKENPKLVKLASTATCETTGVATITYLCQVCGKDTTYTDSAKVVALGHVVGKPVEANRVEPTCTTLGSYDAVVNCTRCGKELERTKDVKIPRLKHTNEKSVSASGVGVPDYTDTTAYIVFNGTKIVDYDGSLQDKIKDILPSDYFGVYARAVTNCEVCQKNIVTLKSLEITVLSVKKENKVGGVGAVTLEASYKKNDGTVLTKQVTLPYFSTSDAYEKYVDDIKITVDGLYKDADGVYRYYVDGEVATNFKGIVEYEGGEFFVANGVLCSTANGLNEYNGKWYFLSQGQIQRGYNGLAIYNGESFYLTNGELTETINGLVPYDGGQFVFASGRLCKEANGLWQDSDGTWYFLSQGQVQTQFTGVAMYDGQFFVVRGGKLASDYNGTIEYDGAKFNVVAGQLYDKVA